MHIDGLAFSPYERSRFFNEIDSDIFPVTGIGYPGMYIIGADKKR